MKMNGRKKKEKIGKKAAKTTMSVREKNRKRGKGGAMATLVIGRMKKRGKM